MRDVNFFIVGAPKCGTTSLANYLNQHPDIYISKPKELNYFSHHEILEQNLYYEDKVIKTINEYKSVFKEAGSERAIGEASVSYLFYPHVAERIYNYNPEAKIIIILRNPIERAYSHYLMDKRIGYVKKDFDHIYFKRHEFPLLYQQYFMIGLYYQQVQKYIDVFGKDSVFIGSFEDFTINTKCFIKKICTHIDVRNDFDFNFLKKHNIYEKPETKLIQFLYSKYWVRKLLKTCLNDTALSLIKVKFFQNNEKPQLNKDLISSLHAYYKDDIEKVSSQFKIKLI